MRSWRSQIPTFALSYWSFLRISFSILHKANHNNLSRQRLVAEVRASRFFPYCVTLPKSLSSSSHQTLRKLNVLSKFSNRPKALRNLIPSNFWRSICITSPDLLHHWKSRLDILLQHISQNTSRALLLLVNHHRLKYLPHSRPISRRFRRWINSYVTVTNDTL